MTVNLNIPEGLVFAIDFRYNGKDAWYRNSGSITGALRGTVTISNGTMYSDVDGEGITYAINSGIEVPRVSGSIISDVTFDTTASDDECIIDLQPNNPTWGGTTDVNVERIFFVRRSSGVIGRSVGNSSGTLTDWSGPNINSAGRKIVMMFWDGFNGSAGTGIVKGGFDGGAPSGVTGITSDRNGTGTNGLISIGDNPDTSTHLRELNGSLHKLTIFNLTNPCGQDLTASGWSADHIWDEIFPSGLSTGISRFTGVSLNGDYRFGSGVKFIAR